MNVPIFLFTFGNGDYNFDADKECRYTVYSYDDKDIWNFIHQYGCFDLNTIKIEVVDYDGDGSLYYNGDWLTEDNKLTTYKFKSNKNRDVVYEVLSTNEIICSILNTEIDKMMIYLELGDSLKHYKDIEFINTIVTLLTEIPHIYFESTSEDGYDIPEIDIDSIYTSFNDIQLASHIRSEDDHIMELTIEGYVAGFTNIMISQEAQH